MQTTEQGDGRFFREGPPICGNTRILNQLAWFGNIPLLLLNTASKSLSLAQRALEQSSPQMGLSTPKGAAQLAFWPTHYEPLSIIRVSMEALQNLKSGPQRTPTLQSYQAISKARDRVREVLQRFPSALMMRESSSGGKLTSLRGAQ